ncbi:DUF4126 domain-containing protein [Actinocorallia longicatena]|uniref:DUF4126 domain-containing protein n=1 Tax=Actinocorallia longicatena TaxID=111803 RepID=A0ABP6QLP3_9ACTN
MFAFLTGLGLASAAGLNAYIPILVVGLLARYSDLVELPSQFAWMSGGWALTIVAVLCAAEFVLDKVPVIDSANDLVMTLIRPAAGGAVMVASTAAGDLDAAVGTGTTLLAEQPWIGWVLGIGTALAVHTTKVTVRPVANAGTLGTAAPVLSTAEDFFSLGLSVVAIIAPVLGLIFMLFLMYCTFRLVRAAHRRRARGRAAPGRPG